VQLTRRHAGEVLRFVAAGATNTLATLLLFQLLVTWLHYQLAYLAAWTCGLAFVVLVYPTFVYRRPVRGTIGRAAIGACYLFTYLLSAALLDLMTRQLGLPPRWGIFLAIIFSMATNYVALLVITARYGLDLR
jgi:putative flippase GtrA